MRRAVDDAAGLTIKAQVCFAARDLGYPAEDWRVREAWYGRAGTWSAAALDDLRARAAAWRGRERAQPSPAVLAQRLGAVRSWLADLQNRFDELKADLRNIVSSRASQGSAIDV